MHDLSLLLKLRADELFRMSATRYEKNPKQRVIRRVHTLIMVLLAVAVFVGLFALSQTLANLGFRDMLPSLGYILATVVTFLMTVLKMNETLAGSEDAEYLLSMPLRNGVQVLTIFLTQYLRNLFYTFLISAPMGIVYATSAPVPGKYWVYWVIGQLFTCMPISGIGSLVGMVIALILSASKRSNLIQSLVAIVTTGVTLQVLFGIVNKLGVVMQQGLGKVPEELASEFVTVFSHNYRFARLFQLGIVEMQPAWTALFMVLSAVWYFFFVFLLTMGYNVIIISLRCPIDYNEYEFKPLKQQSLSRALFKREAAHLFHSRAYFTNSFLGVILGLLIPWNLARVGASTFLGRFTLNAFEHPLAVAMPLILCLFVGLSNTTYASMSLEGKRHWILETTPMNESVLRRAKQKMNLCITVPLALVSALLAYIAFRPGVLLGALYFLLPLGYALVTAWYGSVIGEKYADFSATSEQQAMRQGAPFLLGYLPMVLFPVVLATISFLVV